MITNKILDYLGWLMTFGVTWGSTFKAAPLGSTSPSLGDNRIRENREAVEERAENEHLTHTDGTAGAAALDWTHRQGAAVGYFQDAAPTTRPNGVTALTAADNGRIWFDDNDGDLPRFYVHGTGWVGLIRVNARFSIQGVLATGADVVPRIVFPRAVQITKVSVRVVTAPTDADLQIDLEKNGNAAQSIFDTNDYVKITAAASAGSSTDMESTYSALTADEYLTVDIDQVGSTVAGADLSVTIEARLGADVAI